MKLVFATNNQHKLDEVRKITAGYAENHKFIRYRLP